MIALLAAGMASARALELSLEEAVELALRQNRDLRILTLQLSGRELSVSEENAAFAWALEPRISQQVMDGRSRLSGGGVARRKARWGTELSAGTDVSYDRKSDKPYEAVAYVELRQPLLRRMGRLVTEEPLVQARRAVEAARRELELRRADVVVRVVEVAEELRRLQSQMLLDEEALRRSERLLRLTQAKERLGRATHLDVLRVELQHGANRIRLAETRERLESAQATLAELLGCSAEEPIRVTSAGDWTISPPPLDEALRIAMENRLDYAQVLADCEDAARGVKIARRQLLPNASLALRYERSGRGDSLDEAAEGEDDNWLVVFTAETDARRLRERLAVARALLRVDTAELAAEMFRAALERQLRQTLATYQRIYDEVGVAERNYQLAELRARLARRLYETGRGDSFTVTDAEAAFQEAQHRLLEARAAVTVAAFRLRRALGVLIEPPPDLKPAPRRKTP